MFNSLPWSHPCPYIDLVRQRLDRDCSQPLQAGKTSVCCWYICIWVREAAGPQDLPWPGKSPFQLSWGRDGSSPSPEHHRFPLFWLGKLSRFSTINASPIVVCSCTIPSCWKWFFFFLPILSSFIVAFQGEDLPISSLAIAGNSISTVSLVISDSSLSLLQAPHWGLSDHSKIQIWLYLSHNLMAFHFP